MHHQASVVHCAKDWYDLNGGESPDEKKRNRENEHPGCNYWEEINGKKYLSTGPFTSVDEDGNKYYELP